MSDESNENIVPQLPHFRASPTPGRVLFGFSAYQHAEAKDVGLTYETTPDRARIIAAELIAAAMYAERIAAKFPALVPVDDTKAIEA